MSLCRQSSEFKFILLPSVKGLFESLLNLTTRETTEDTSSHKPIGLVAVGSNGNAGGNPTRFSASLEAKADSSVQFIQKQCLKLG